MGRVASVASGMPENRGRGRSSPSRYHFIGERIAK